jgi:hypothetical protein
MRYKKNKKAFAWIYEEGTYSYVVYVKQKVQIPRSYFRDLAAIRCITVLPQNL